MWHISPSCPISLSRNSSTVLNRSSENKYLSFLPDLSSIYSFTIKFAVLTGFFRFFAYLWKLRKFPFIPTALNTSIMKDVGIKFFFCIYWGTCGFSPLLICCITLIEFCMLELVCVLEWVIIYFLIFWATGVAYGIWKFQG